MTDARKVHEFEVRVEQRDAYRFEVSFDKPDWALSKMRRVRLTRSA